MIFLIKIESKKCRIASDFVTIAIVFVTGFTFSLLRKPSYGAHFDPRLGRALRSRLEKNISYARSKKAKIFPLGYPLRTLC